MAVAMVRKAVIREGRIRRIRVEGAPLGLSNLPQASRMLPAPEMS